MARAGPAAIHTIHRVSDLSPDAFGEEVLEVLLQRRILFVTGRGATGKSTIAAALALVAAKLGKRALCASTSTSRATLRGPSVFSRWGSNPALHLLAERQAAQLGRLPGRVLPS
jgi:Mrp family chromosome partitioning ATPase